METVYKLTDSQGQTRNNMQWGEGVTHTATGGDKPLCSDAWLHAYRHPLLAVLLNPAHGSFDPQSMQLWKCEAEVGKDTGDKIGCTSITTLLRIAIPNFTVIQKCAFAILTARHVFGGKNKIWDDWASDWLANKNNARTWSATVAAEAATVTVAVRAAWEAAEAEAEAAAVQAATVAVAVQAATVAIDYKILLSFAEQVLREF